MDVLYIVMPAYNEEENIENTVKQWYPIVEKHNGDGKSRLVVFNDGSKDGTLEKGKSLMKKYPLFEMIDKPNQGHGPTLIMAYNYAINKGADYVFQTDSDGQTNPEEFEAFWNKRNDSTALIGVRHKRGDGESRAFVEKVVCLLLRLYFGVKVQDANAPFRLMKSNVLKKYVDKLPEDYNLPNIMITTFYVYYKEKVEFLPISFSPRKAGTNSINIKRIVKIGWNALGDFREFRLGMRLPSKTY